MERNGEVSMESRAMRRRCVQYSQMRERGASRDGGNLARWTKDYKSGSRHCRHSKREGDRENMTGRRLFEGCMYESYWTTQREGGFGEGDGEGDLLRSGVNDVVGGGGCWGGVATVGGRPGRRPCRVRGEPARQEQEVWSDSHVERNTMGCSLDVAAVGMSLDWDYRGPMPPSTAC